ncbi:response regulator transcription factor [Cellulomonas septica]|uniref:Response regulator transcription factor n=1 Tax=Cellulomonas septica TaxID=285080 RepID=A0ABX1JUT1_9CELL|nr:response regulator transcription factor [Cellulomonas septica]NKY38068.1 response regulator transcription factor [Cellulomonas septica]
MRRTVLLIEDDARIRRVVELALTADGFAFAAAASGEEGLDLLSRRVFDVVLLDLMLPGRDGLDVCREIRRTSDAPIIMVTARADSHDVVGGLEAGADDYVTKPFVAKELSARIRALLRRSAGTAAREPVQVGDLTIDTSAGLVHRDGVPVELTKTEFGLLCELAAVPGRVVSREELLERLWGYDYFGDARLVDVHVGRLRKKVEPDPSAPAVVLTVRGMGYRLGA